MTQTHYRAKKRPPTAGDPLPGAGTSVVIMAGHLLFGQCIAEALVGVGFAVTLSLYDQQASALEAVRDAMDPLVLLDLDTAGPVEVTAIVEPLRAEGGRVVVLTSPATHLEAAECVAAGALAAVDKRGPIAPLVRTLLEVAQPDSPTYAPDSTLANARGRGAMVNELLRLREQDRARMQPFLELTPAEQDVLCALMEGNSINDIAQLRFVSSETVRSQVKAILRKLGVGSQLGAVALARSSGWNPVRHAS